MEFVKVCPVADFGPNRVRSFQILGKFIGVVHEPEGKFYAIEIACKHNNADLTEGRFRGDIVTCHRHGWVYNIRTGACLNRPSAPLRRHGLKIENGVIWVSVTPLEEAPEEEEPFPELQIRSKPGRDGAL